jgi:hypothetical protein
MTSDQIGVAFGMLVAIVAVGGAFGFVSVVVYSENRRKEREAFYRAEVYKRLLEQTAGGADQLRALILVEEAARARQLRDGLLIAGLLAMAVGAAMLMLQRGGGDWVLWRIGWIPLFAGIAMMIFVALTSSRTKAEGRGN